MKSQGYTLWLMPKGHAYQKFSGLIKRLARENQAPVFEPHVTLLGEILLPETEIIKRTERLVAGQKPFAVTMEQIGYENYFFRTLFVRAKKTTALLDLHELAKKIFQMQALPYMPHLSILYGIFPVSTKEKIIKEIGRDQSVEFEVNSVVLMKGGEIKDWKIIKEFEFSRSVL